MRQTVPAFVVTTRTRRAGFSLLEALAVLAILGILAAVAMPRFFSASDETRKNGCYTNTGDIEIQVQLWVRNHGSLPNSSLSDIASDGEYFPDGLPVCPVDGTPYTIDPDTGRVIGHTH